MVLLFINSNITVLVQYNIICSGYFIMSLPWCHWEGSVLKNKLKNNTKLKKNNTKLRNNTKLKKKNTEFKKNDTKFKKSY